jgi:hypothetical protein
MFDYHYNANLRKLIVGFGSLFSNILIKHTDPTTQNDVTIRVPIHYSPQEKFIQRLLEPSSITDGTRIETQVPVISFIMNSVSADPSRRLGRLATNSNQQTGASCGAGGNQIKTQLPVNVNFNLFVYTRHTEDMLQIIEQIMPYFLPEHIITLNMNAVQTEVQIPIVMVGNNFSERYEGDFSSRRLNIATFQFMAKSWLFGQVAPVTGIEQTAGTYGFTGSINFDID